MEGKKTDAVSSTSPLGTTSSSVPPFPFPGTTPQLPTSNILGPSTTTPTIPPTTIVKPPSPPSPPPVPPRDLMGDFTKWFVLGDEGLIEEFRAYMLENILQSVYTKFHTEQEEQRQKEESERAAAKADQFRAYNLSVKYFYRWRDMARELRLKQLRRSGRDQMRAFYEAQRAAQLKAQKKAARRAAREKAEIAQLNRPEEFKELLRHNTNVRQAEMTALSRATSGVNHEDMAPPQIMNRPPSVNGSTTSDHSSLSRSTASRGGSKTQALRMQLLGDEPASFRRSLPLMSSRVNGNSDSEPSVSRVSERWRLKAMGIVQMPDGTAIPASLANEPRKAKNKYSGIGSMGPPVSPVVRRASISGLTNQDGRLLSSQRTASHVEVDGATAKHKRKRTTDDDDEANRQGTSEEKSHKRVMSDAQILMNELRAMREEMEEGATWFRGQNEKLQSELNSRSSTPWDESA